MELVTHLCAQYSAADEGYYIWQSTGVGKQHVKNTVVNLQSNSFPSCCEQLRDTPERKKKLIEFICSGAKQDAPDVQRCLKIIYFVQIGIPY
jgi:hypothetical protein